MVQFLEKIFRKIVKSGFMGRKEILQKYKSNSSLWEVIYNNFRWLLKSKKKSQVSKKQFLKQKSQGKKNWGQRFYKTFQFRLLNSFKTNKKSVNNLDLT
jgi:alpha-galactosidase/6-phospho-beta-glucosidase family protein